MNYLERARQALYDYRARTSRPAPDDPREQHDHAEESGPVSRSDSWSGVDGDVLELRVPFLGDTIFFVHSDEDVLPLLHEGISRGRIWTVEQLNDLFNIPDLGPSGRITITIARAMFDGEVVSVTRREESVRSEQSPREEGSALSPREESEGSEKRAEEGRLRDA